MRGEVVASPNRSLGWEIATIFPSNGGDGYCIVLG